MIKNTFIVNLLGGPGIGKSTLSAIIYAKLKLKNYTVEYVQEYAKSLVWTKDFDTLNNQRYVTQTQYNLLKNINGQVDFIVTDGAICTGIYYNLHNKDNTSNVQKTENYIIECFNKFNNINIFLERGDFPFEIQGRLQNEEESKEIDIILKHLLKQNKIDFALFKSNCDEDNINKIVDYIITSFKSNIKPVNVLKPKKKYASPLLYNQCEICGKKNESTTSNLMECHFDSCNWVLEEDKLIIPENSIKSAPSQDNMETMKIFCHDCHYNVHKNLE